MLCCQGERKSRFAGFQENIGESLEFLYRPRNAGVRLANENSFAIDDLLFTAFRIITVMNRTVFPTALKRRRQLAGRTILAKEQLRERHPPFLSRIPGFEQPRHMFNPRSHIHRAAGSDDDDGVPIESSDLPDQFILRRGQLKCAITAFALAARIKTDRRHNRVSARRQGLCGTLDHRVGTYDSHSYAWSSPTPVNKVLEADLVRACCD